MSDVVAIKSYILIQKIFLKKLIRAQKYVMDFNLQVKLARGATLEKLFGCRRTIKMIFS
jgi:hypothetical protein